AQEANTSLQRGYRTGYSDGYMAGYRDIIDGQTKDLRRHEDYSNASRAYSQDYGPIEDYRDGYRQGFKAGYDTGFEKRTFDSTIPTNLVRRGESTPTVTTQPAPAASVTAGPVPDATTAQTSQPVSYRSDDSSTIVIPKDAELIIELQDELSTEKNREGDRFTAKVVSPMELEGATVEGRVSKIQKPGRIKRRSEMSLSFDRIVLSGDRWSNFSGTLTEVMPVKGDGVRRIDEEGTAVGKSSIKPDSIKVGAATGTGAVVGAVAGGPVGAAVGAGVGAAFGVGAVVVERGKHINLNKNQQLRIRSAYDTRIR
ncbi:MAG TPA: hypothetical protein VHL50_09645, partial [Pyrinomonadaceae bacterium]|nr:hypothetical protein [Pyrinomonadaceae bacterium]